MPGLILTPNIHQRQVGLLFCNFYMQILQITCLKVLGADQTESVFLLSEVSFFQWFSEQLTFLNASSLKKINSERKSI